LLSPEGVGHQDGPVAEAGDVDFFQFDAPITGQLEIRQVVAAGSDLDSVLTIYDGMPQGIAFNDGDGVTLNSLVYVDVSAGQTYDILVRLGKGDGTFGTYQRIGRNIPLAVADLNNNGFADLVVANNRNGLLNLFLGGGGGLTLTQTFFSAEALRRTAVAFVDLGNGTFEIYGSDEDDEAATLVTVLDFHSGLPEIRPEPPP